MPSIPAQVLVVGSVNVDLTLALPSLPRPGETVIGGSVTRALGGKGANQAAAAARLGVRTTLVGRIGSDADGEFARQALVAAGVEVGRLGVDPEQPTGLATVLTDPRAENLIAVASGANARLTAALVRQALAGLDDAVLVANLEIPLEAVQATAEVAHDRQWPFVLNPAPARPLPAELLALVDVLTPNEHELTALELTGFTGTLIVTRGRDGLDLIENNQPAQRISAFAVDPVDSTGAGDACTGAIAWALATGHCMGQAAMFGAAAGALATRAVGAQAALPSEPELHALVDGGQRL